MTPKVRAERPSFRRDEYEPPLDPGIARAVELLRLAGVETYQSCHGGPGHSFPEPTVQFHGNRFAGFDAVEVALTYGLPVRSLARVWIIVDGEPTGPEWELRFWHQMEPLSEADWQGAAYLAAMRNRTVREGARS